jgi:hypothetical protein
MPYFQYYVVAMGKESFSKYSFSSPPLSSPSITTTTKLKKNPPIILEIISYTSSNRTKQPKIKTVVNVTK